MNPGVEYIKYRWNAVGRHGIHSPFVFDFVDKCLITKLAASEKEKINALDQKLKKDPRTITIEDFGAGSQKMGSERTVKNIYKWSSSKGKYGELLYKISKYYQPKRILELGTSLGLGTCYLSLGNPDAKITTVEGCKATRSISKENFKHLELTNIDSVLNNFKTFIEENSENFDLVFIDGHHDGEALLNYLNSLREVTTNDTIFVLDDIRWSDSMLDAWNTIRNSAEYNVSIDLFRVGIVIPRKQQEKEHFIVRY